MNTIAFIQARMGSTRLPGKVLLDLAGKPVLQHVVERVQAAESIDEVIVVTTIHAHDLPIVGWCASHGIRVFCGSEDDVLDRFYQAAKLVLPDAMLRITADCPLMDPQVIDRVVHFFRAEHSDYANNVEHETYPDGLDVEVFRFAALEKAWKEATLISEREHVTPYIRKHPELFKVKVLDHAPSLAGMRWTLDQKEDFAFIKRVHEELGAGHFGMQEVIDLLVCKPELQSINGSIVRNEGYLKSINQDQQTGPRS
jgi:spore coat polysaccharide biosynthesis protein SpsF (cytidylyltransferase family)